MSDYYNPIATALGKETDFINNINNATKRLFEEANCEIIYNAKNREIKAVRDDEKMVVYVLDKQKNKIIVTFSEIHDYNKDSSIKEIIYWDHREKDGEVSKDLYMNNVIECSLKNNKKSSIEKIPKSAEEFENSLKEQVKEDNLVKNFIDSIKSVFGENYFTNQEFFNGVFNPNKNIKCSIDSGTVQQYTNYLNKKGYLAEVKSDEFFIKLNDSQIPKYQDLLQDWIIVMNSLIKVCEENNYHSYEHAFVYNDLDNFVWLEKGKLVLTNQNVGFYFHIKDANNFTVYCLEKQSRDVEEEISRIDTQLKDGTIQDSKDLAIKVKNGKIVQLTYSLMKTFELDMEYSIKSMTFDGLLKVEYPVDITTYQYQKNYYAHKFGLNEFEFITQAMMTLGGGFDYDKEKGIFIDDSVKYIQNLPESPSTRDQKIKKFNYLLPKKISNLNPDWLDGLKYAVDVLKKYSPKPVVYEGENEKDALEKAIKYYEIKIAKLEAPKIKP